MLGVSFLVDGTVLRKSVEVGGGTGEDELGMVA
jgi:hypothetical protein